MQIRIERLDTDLPLPVAQHPDDAGYDLHAREDVLIPQNGGRVLVPTGIAVAIPSGHAGFVLPRSGLALRHGITCLNTPGLIDPLYRGEIKVVLVNTDPRVPYQVHRGDRIAQLVVQRVDTIEWQVVDNIGTTRRDAEGFGSTGR